MKAAVYRGRGELAVEEVDSPPAPPAGQVQIAVSYAAVCGSDSGEWDHGPMIAVPPVILGHEFTGTVSAVGPEVTTLAVGDRVVCGAGVSCGDCEWCAEGRTNLCANYHTLGLHIDGGLAELVNAPISTLIKVPDDVPANVAALTQPLAVAIHAVRRSGVTPGQTCVLIGAGGIGAFIVAAAVAQGISPLIVLDIDDERLATARSLGATTTINVTDQDLGETILAATDGEGPHVIIEATGVAHAPAAALNTVRRGGRVLLVGLQSAPREVDLFGLILREVDVATTLAHVLAEDLAEALEILRTTGVFDTVVGATIELDDVLDQGIRQLAEGRAKGKIVVQISE